MAARSPCGTAATASSSRARLHGPIRHLLVEAAGLHAASDLGDWLSWDLRALHLDHRELLREVWRDLPVVWESGAPEVREPPGEHPCR